MTNSKKSLATIKIVDVFGNPIAKAQYQVKNQKTGGVIAAGATNNAGCIVEISRDKGTVLDVYVKSMFNGMMLKVQTFTMSKDRMLVKIASPKVLLDLQTLQTQGANGKYKRKTHTVKKGETLTSIASQNHTTVIALERLNKLDDPDKINVGQVIKLPVNIPATGSNAHHDKPKKPTSKPSTPSKPKPAQTTAPKPKATQPQGAKKSTGTTQKAPTEPNILDSTKAWASEQAHNAYESGVKLFNEVTSIKIPTVGDRSQDGGTPKSNVANLCKTKPQCIDSGNSELIREVNIRLAGFGGALPTDQFTELTAKCIKQFQRDYMGVPETGKICGSVLLALDKFSKEYPINNYFNQMKCPCKSYGGGKECDGFGAGRTKQYPVTPKGRPGNYAIEYPGIHRSVIWIFKATCFYINKIDKKQFTVNKIDSAYRCIENNNKHNGKKEERTTVNHMGLAFDLHFNKKGVRTREEADMNLIRSALFGHYMGASTVRGDNKIYLEPAWYGRDEGATTWVHFDLTRLTKQYLTKDLFARSIYEAEKGDLIELAKVSKASNLISCSGQVLKNNQINSNKLSKGTSIGGIIGKVIASHESSGDYNIFNRGTEGKYANTSGKEDISKRTIDEWISLGDLPGSNINKRLAMGKYQIIPKTLKVIKGSMDLTGDEKITNELQERIFKEYYVKNRMYDAITNGNQKKYVDVCLKIAKEWASVGVPYNTERVEKDKKGNVKKRISLKKGDSYWSGVGGNKAHTTPESVIKALEQMNSDYKKLIQEGKSSDDAFDIIMATDKAIYN